VTKPAEAMNVLRELKSSPPFASAYGKRFIQRLQKTIEDDDKEKRRAIQAKQEAAKKEQAAKKIPRETKAKKEKPERVVKTDVPVKREKPVKKANTEKKVHIITRRNILIGAVIIVLAVGVRFAWPYVQPYFGGEQGSSKEEMHRNLVLSYAKNQVELKESFYNYYKNAQGQDDETAAASANEVLANAYCINLAGEDVSDYTDDQIEEIYVKLITAGELVNNSFNEPQAITDMKAVVSESGVAGLTSDTADGSDSQTQDSSTQVSQVNKMMDYQQRTAAQLTYDYSHFDFDDQEISEYVAEDMEKIFGYTVYDMSLSDSEKESYYELFLNKGFFANGELQRVESNPVAYGLPDLTPTIKLEINDDTQELSCTQQTLAAAASVTYELHNGKKTGYIVLRNDGIGTDFVQDDDGNSVSIQGDVFVNWGGKITCGEWYYNSGKLGFLVSDQKSGSLQYVYDIVY
jgi:hypothetical protein